jgi:hypothetical protein
MFLFLRNPSRAFSACAVGLLAFSGFSVAGGQAIQGDSELSGPPQMNVNYQAREPRLCKGLTAAPNPRQAAALVQCTMDVDRPTGLFLMQEVTLAMEAPRAYAGETDGNLAEIDMTAPVIALSGSLKVYWCSPVGPGYPAGRNCQMSPTPMAAGKCWKTTFGDWKCNLIGPTPNSRSGLAGPTTY